MSDTTYAIEMRGISKRFGSVQANRDISFAVARGEIHAIVGENGAGKTTLMNILFGMHQPNLGEILINGKQVAMHSPKIAIDNGLGMVHQHFKLVPSLTIADNIFLGMEITKAGLVDRKAQVQKVRDLSETFGLHVDPNRLVRDLSVGVEQRVEIIKVLARGADIVILDEPTAVLTPQESRDLFRILRDFVTKGMTVVFISHHLSEVMEVSDRITVLRDGQVIGTRKTATLDDETLINMMVGRNVSFARRSRTHASRADNNQGAPALKLDNIWCRDTRGVATLRDISMEVGVGQIVGIIGVDGNGQSELAEVISGLRPPSHGTISLAGQHLPEAHPFAARQAGLAHVPGDRLVRGVEGGSSIAYNILMGQQHSTTFAHKGIIDWKRVNTKAAALIEQFDIRAEGIATTARTLSGGNMQKLVLAREFSQGAKLLLVDQPTRGVDIGAMEGIHDEIMRQREAGAAILLISVQIDEIMALADRILVMFGGRIVGELDPETTTEDEIGFLMAGGRQDAKVSTQ